MRGPVFESSFFRSKEGWVPKAGDEPKATDSFRGSLSVKDGGGTHAQEPAEIRRLDGVSRPERRISVSSSNREAQEISKASVGREVL